MGFDKLCYKCKRIYRGEGYNGVCTAYCYARPYAEDVPKKKTILEPAPVDKRQQAIEKANARWLSKDYIAKDSPKHGSKRNPKFCPSMLVETDGWGKQYKACRG
jgi:hypothetical protein